MAFLYEGQVERHIHRLRGIYTGLEAYTHVQHEAKPTAVFASGLTCMEHYYHSCD